MKIDLVIGGNIDTPHHTDTYHSHLQHELLGGISNYHQVVVIGKQGTSRFSHSLLEVNGSWHDSHKRKKQEIVSQ